ncbi:MAG: tRNA adenosine(34) deaminase TadA [Endomicrobia bacterium]|nr:tRNA adenosine(34) deaminase TadA [Endomicrobiia bacterium]MCX7940789.1 tRNA adenosine(34) deaminase TadA [Endomicrobiia bacterium]MDW8055617.1 tRNA adenosine(34) deaminase TadA [Elusimicrobiota bacterium]
MVNYKHYERDKHFMLIALKEAKKAYAKNEVPVGAIVVCKDKVISKAHNLNIKLNDPTAHAEILALRKASNILKNYRLTDCELYTTLEPCPMCAGAMVYARIKRLVYATDDPKSGACKSVVNIVNNKRLNHRIEVVSGVCKKEAEHLLKKFFKNLR